MKDKIKLPLGTSLLKHDQRMFLRTMFPFLSQEFRLISKEETDSPEVWEELFGELPYVDGYLKAIYFYQN